jgi:hypothetical protein
MWTRLRRACALGRVRGAETKPSHPSQHDVRQHAYHRTKVSAAFLPTLRELAEELGHTPTIAELQAREDLPSPYTYRDRFGRWSEALREAGLTPRHSIGRPADAADGEVRDRRWLVGAPRVLSDQGRLTAFNAHTPTIEVRPAIELGISVAALEARQVEKAPSRNVRHKGSSTCATPSISLLLQTKARECGILELGIGCILRGLR